MSAATISEKVVNQILKAIFVLSLMLVPKIKRETYGLGLGVKELADMMALIFTPILLMMKITNISFDLFLRTKQGAFGLALMVKGSYVWKMVNQQPSPIRQG